MTDDTELGRIQNFIYWLIRNNMPAKDIEAAAIMARERSNFNIGDPLYVYAKEIARNLVDD